MQEVEPPLLSEPHIPWFICHQCLNTHVLLLCFQSLRQTKIDSVIDSSLSRAWLSIWGRNLKSLTGSQRAGVTPRFLIIIPLAGLSSFFPWKVWIWPFDWSSRLPYSVTCDGDTKGFAGGQPTGFYLRSTKWFSRTQLAPQSLAQCPKCAVILVAL